MLKNSSSESSTESGFTDEIYGQSPRTSSSSIGQLWPPKPPYQPAPERVRSPLRPESRPHIHGDRSFPMRWCSQCGLWGKLGDWNATPPDAADRCFHCGHLACGQCVDSWSTKEETGMADLARRRSYDARERLGAKRSAISADVICTISRHAEQRKD